ncbi:MAG: peptidase S8, partial [Microbacterium sp.]
MIRPLAAVLAGAAVALTLITAAPAAAVTLPEEAPTTDPVRDAEYWLADYGIEKAWETTRGKGVRIAVIDTGIGKGPIEFEGAVVGGTDVSGAGTSDGR